MTEHDQDDSPTEGDAPAVSALPGTPTDARAGFVALIGVPNAGKSTLLNQLVGTKVSIVSRKVQTTRALVRGILIEGSAQVVPMTRLYVPITRSMFTRSLPIRST